MSWRRRSPTRGPGWTTRRRETIAYGADAWDVERTRYAAEVIEQRGDHLTTVAAVDDATGAIVGFTELVVPGDGKGDAQHYGTAVLPHTAATVWPCG